MKIKLIVLFIGLIITSLSVNAQRCKFIVDDKDPITDDILRTIKTRITGPIAGVTPYYYFYYIRTGSNYVFRVEIADYGKFNHTIPAKSELIIRLEDGELIRIYAVGEANPTPITDWGEELTSYDVSYEISEEDISKISKAGITFIRGTDFKNTFSDQRIPSPITLQSKNNAICVVED
jgi:hypothetical protein